jgi:hypothetical protein
MLLSRSDPKSADYGKYYSQEDVVSLFSPEQQTIDSVTSWLVSSGIPKDSIHLRKSQGWIAFETTAGELESLLKTKYYTYEHNERGGMYVGTDEYQLPKKVSDYIDFVSPGVAFLVRVRTQWAPNLSLLFPCQRYLLLQAPKTAPRPSHQSVFDKCTTSQNLTKLLRAMIWVSLS